MVGVSCTAVHFVRFSKLIVSFYLSTEVASGASAISVLLQPIHEPHAELEV